MTVTIPPGIKLGTHVPADATDETLAYLKQLGLHHVRVHIHEDDDSEAYLRSVKERFASHGLTIFTIVYMGYKAKEIALGLPGRDAKLKRLTDFIQTMGRLGLHTLDYDFFLYAPLPSTGTAQTRGAQSRAFDLAHAGSDKLAFGKIYTDDDIWANYHYFLNAVLPVAQAAGVRLALHPDDPPIPMLNGTARIFRNLDGFKKAAALANGNSAWGVLFCVGTWAEGGNTMGATIQDAIRYFASHDQLFTLHFRNVSAPLPRFVETFIDNGYVDMADIIRTLVDVNYNGLLIPDHFPTFTGDPDQKAALAYATGYIRGLLPPGSEYTP